MISKFLFKGALSPANAVCAIIINNNKILLQKRDNKKNIFFPNHYGLFGGAIEKREKKRFALKRELHEEIGLNLNLNRFEFFNEMVLDFNPIKKKKFIRSFYLLNLKNIEKKSIKLGEGSEMKWINPSYAYNNLRITPYDAYVIWLYLYNKKK